WFYSNLIYRLENSNPKSWQSEAVPSFGFYVLSKAYIAIYGHFFGGKGVRGYRDFFGILKWTMKASL
ncbi:MAG: hypothetical protein ACK470_17990, partial [Pseudanabaena sp.]